MINERIFLGYPIDFKKKCYIYPPKVNEVVGNKNYGEYYKLLTTSQEDLEDIYLESNINEIPPTPLEHIMFMAYNDKAIEGKIKEAFMYFIHETVDFIYEKKIILLGGFSQLNELNSIEELRMIAGEDEFFEFQNAIRESTGANPVEKPNPNEHPKIKAMKAKARYRDRVKAKEGKTLEVSSLLVSICCMNFGLNPLNIGEISYAALPWLMRYYQEKEKYETDIKSLIAGADSKKVKPVYWIRNIDD